MKQIAIISILFICVTANGQKKDVSMRDLQGLTGNWKGTVTNTAYTDNKTKKIMHANLVIAEKTDSLLMTISFEPEDKTEIDQYGFRIYNEGRLLHYERNEYTIVDVRRVENSLVIVADREGTDNKREADIRIALLIDPRALLITKEVKYKGVEKYFIRTKLEFTKQRI